MADMNGEWNGRKKKRGEIGNASTALLWPTASPDRARPVRAQLARALKLTAVSRDHSPSFPSALEEKRTQSPVS